METIVRSRTFRRFGIPAIGWSVSIAFALLGPLSFWQGYFLVGATWALTFPLRMVIREWSPEVGENPLAYVIRDLTDRWYDLVEEDAPLGIFTLLCIVVFETVAWLVIVPVGAYFLGNIYD